MYKKIGIWLIILSITMIITPSITAIESEIYKYKNDFKIKSVSEEIDNLENENENENENDLAESFYEYDLYYNISWEDILSEDFYKRIYYI